MTTDWLLRDIEPSEPHAGTDAHMSPAQARAGAPLLLCLTLGASACGLFLLFYGRFVSSSTIPSTIGIIVQICAIAMAMGFGLYLKNGIDAEQGSGFIRAFWRVDIWMIALLPMRVIYFAFLQLMQLIPAAVLGAGKDAAVRRRASRAVSGGVPVCDAGAVPPPPAKGLKKLYLFFIF